MLDVEKVIMITKILKINCLPISVISNAKPRPS
jgi:hypothetical protein